MPPISNLGGKFEKFLLSVDVMVGSRYDCAFFTIPDIEIMSATENNREIKMDKNDLYREEVITDRRVGSIRVLTPVTEDGAQDRNREIIYVGQAQMLTPMGAVPLSFAIEANSLPEAIDKFSDAANQALEQTAKELQELRREQASSIVVPGSDQLPGVPGGGKIQLK